MCRCPTPLRRGWAPSTPPRRGTRRPSSRSSAQAPIKAEAVIWYPFLFGFYTSVVVCCEPKIFSFFLFIINIVMKWIQWQNGNPAFPLGCTIVSHMNRKRLLRGVWWRQTELSLGPRRFRLKRGNVNIISIHFFPLLLLSCPPLHIFNDVSSEQQPCPELLGEYYAEAPDEFVATAVFQNVTSFCLQVGDCRGDSCFTKPERR